jgi:hypothetical protein
MSMEIKQVLSPRSALLVVVLVACAALCFAASRRMTGGTPHGTAMQLTRALSEGRLEGIRAALAPDCYKRFVGAFAEAKYARVRSVYREVSTLGTPVWREYRRLGDEIAEGEYQRLRGEVERLGREAFARMPVAERLRLMDDAALYRREVIRAGAAVLPGPDRSEFDDPGEFEDEPGHRRFVARARWSLLPSDKRALAGGPAALADETSPEKTAFVDRLGVPLLAREAADEIRGITRADLENQAAFLLKYGEASATQLLASAPVETARQVACVYSGVQDKGSLLNGDAARCEITWEHPSRLTARIGLGKTGGKWFVLDSEPSLSQLVTSR